MCGRYGFDHDIKNNSKENAILIFKTRFMMNLDSPKFNFNGSPITKIEYIKYLERIITNDCKDDTDINTQCCHIYAQVNVCIRKSFMCSPNVKLILFRPTVPHFSLVSSPGE